jgi:hypothetical protein
LLDLLGGLLQSYLRLHLGRGLQTQICCHPGENDDKLTESFCFLGSCAKILHVTNSWAFSWWFWILLYRKALMSILDFGSYLSVLMRIPYHGVS